ncbi:MAG: dienelactone hydrolase family protein [Gammaproteobacteria bacterium]
MPNESESALDIATRDGTCRCFKFTPKGKGPWRGVIVYMDAFAIRPALLELGQRIADLEFFVLVPDLFYRSGPYAAMDPHAIFGNADAFTQLKEKFIVRATVANVMSDTQAFLDYLAGQPLVRPEPVGTTGYCMGGRFSLAAAGTFPARIAASASFHGGNLASDDPASPHLLAPKMKAYVFVAGATGDNSFPDDMKNRLEHALTEAHVAHTVETWPAKHGWTFHDTPVYDATCFERHLQVLKRLFADTLNKPR